MTKEGVGRTGGEANRGGRGRERERDGRGKNGVDVDWAGTGQQQTFQKLLRE